MDVERIRELDPQLRDFLGRFAHCFSRPATRGHFVAYVNGQLSELERKNVEAMANLAGVPPRTLQEFLTQYVWDEEALRSQLQQIVATEHASEHSIGIIDETSFVKKGDKTPGVQRQHCGTIGKHENCMVTVHLAYAAEDFHCLLDGELFLPESWSKDRQRCEEAGIPEDMKYRPKTEIALELFRRAKSNGVKFRWLTFDEWYGAKPAFLETLAKEGQHFVAEVHKNHMIWVDRPRVTTRGFRRHGRGRSRRTPRLVAGSPKAHHIHWWMTRHRALKEQRWEKWHLKDTEKGPQVVEVKHALVYPKNSEGFPAQAHHLLVVRDAVAYEAPCKYFLSNAPAHTSKETLLKVAYSRWRVERCFQDDKGRVGLDDYEGRRYPGLLRHLMISAVSFLFLARVRHALRESYPELTVRQVRTVISALIQSWWQTPATAARTLAHAARVVQYHQRRNEQARKSHTKTRMRELRAFRIDLDAINRCNWEVWDTS